MGVSIQCQNKDYYLEKILTLPEEIQAQLLIIIEPIFSKHNDIDQDTNMEDILNINFEENVKKEKKLLEKLDEIENENCSLNRVVQELREEKEDFNNTIKNLNLKLEQKSKELKQNKQKFNNDVKNYLY